MYNIRQCHAEIMQFALPSCVYSSVSNDNTRRERLVLTVLCFSSASSMFELGVLEAVASTARGVYVPYVFVLLSSAPPQEVSPNYRRREEVKLWGDACAVRCSRRFCVCARSQTISKYLPPRLHDKMYQVGEFCRVSHHLYHACCASKVVHAMSFLNQ